jgi:SAM-dependent methyltransferase
MNQFSSPVDPFWVDNSERFDRAMAVHHAPFLGVAAITPTDRVLDVGCGIGRVTLDAAHAAAAGSAMGVDLSAPMIGYARRAAHREGLGNVTFEHADTQVHPFADSAFDVAISLNEVMFAGDPVAAFANIARALRPGGRLIGIHSHGHDPGIEIIDRVWPGDDPFKTDRYAILRQVKHELGAAARHYNFNASSDARSIFRYHMHTLPDEVSGPIGTSTLFAAWNAAIYVAQIEDVRLSEVVRDGRYLEATDAVLKKHGGLWFNDETYVISRRRAPA